MDCGAASQVAILQYLETKAPAREVAVAKRAVGLLTQHLLDHLAVTLIRQSASTGVQLTVRCDQSIELPPGTD